MSKKAFLFGYTRLIQRAPRRLELSSTLEELLGGCFDIFDEAQHGQRTGKMTKEDFIAYQVRHPRTVLSFKSLLCAVVAACA